MRIFRELSGRIRDMYLLEQLDRPGGFGGFTPNATVAHGFSKLTADSVDRAQRRHGILRDERDVLAANLRESLGLPEDFAVLELHGSGGTARSSASSPRMPMAVVDLPEPDSPMIVTVSPASMQKETPSTARMTPLAVTSSICSSSTFSRFPTSRSRSVGTEFVEESPQARSGGPVAQTVAEQVHPTTNRTMTRPGRVTSHHEVVM